MSEKVVRKNKKGYLQVLSIQLLERSKMIWYMKKFGKTKKESDKDSDLIQKFMDAYNDQHQENPYEFTKEREGENIEHYDTRTYRHTKYIRSNLAESEKKDGESVIESPNAMFVIFFHPKVTGQTKQIFALTSGQGWQVVRPVCNANFPIDVIEKIGSTKKKITSITKRSIFGTEITQTLENVHMNNLFQYYSLYYFVEEVMCDIDNELGSDLIKVIIDSTEENNDNPTNSSDSPSEKVLEKLSNNSSDKIPLINSNGTDDDNDNVGEKSDSPSEEKRQKIELLKKTIRMKITTGGILRIEEKLPDITIYGKVLECIEQYLPKPDEESPRIKRFFFFNLLHIDEDILKSELNGELAKLIAEKKANDCAVRHPHSNEFLMSRKFEIAVPTVGKRKHKYTDFGTKRPEIHDIIDWIDDQTKSTDLDEKILLLKEGRMRFSTRYDEEKSAKIIDFIEGEVDHDNKSYFKIRMKWYRMQANFLALLHKDFEAVKNHHLMSKNDKGCLPVPWKKKSCILESELQEKLGIKDAKTIKKLITRLRTASASYISDKEVVQRKLDGNILKNELIKKNKGPIESVLEHYGHTDALTEEDFREKLLEKDISENDVECIWKELNATRKIIEGKKTFFVGNPIFSGLEKHLIESELKVQQLENLINYLEFCALNLNEGEYNLSYFDEDLLRRYTADSSKNHQYLVFDTITPDGIEPCDILWYTEDTTYLYHVKEKLGHETRDVCSQIHNAADYIWAALKTNEENNYLQKLWNTILEGKPKNSTSKGQWDKLKNELEKLGFGKFVNLFRFHDIVFVYAYLPGVEEEKRNKLKDNIRILCKKHKYMNEHGEMTERFFDEKKNAFVKNLSETGLITQADCRRFHAKMTQSQALEKVYEKCKKVKFLNESGDLTSLFLNITKGEIFKQQIKQSDENRGELKDVTDDVLGAAYEELCERESTTSNIAKLELIRLSEKFKTFSSKFQFKICAIPRSYQSGEENLFDGNADSGDVADDASDEDAHATNNLLVNTNQKINNHSKDNKYDFGTNKENIQSNNASKFFVKKSTEHPRALGLKNLGNTCYMNSIIQCLSNTHQLTAHLTSDECTTNLYSKKKNHDNTSECITEELAKIIKYLHNNSRTESFSPRHFKTLASQLNDRYKGADQQDAHEFLLHLFEWIHEDLKKEHVISERENNPAWQQSQKEKGTSIIDDLFYNQIISTVKCLNCSYETDKEYSRSNCVTLYLLDVVGKCFLEDLVENYLEPQHLPGWKCPECQSTVSGVRKMDIRLPNTLILCLIRFDNSSEKNKTRVEFPLDNFRPQGISDYELYATVNHRGDNIHSGHYIAYCKSAIQEKSERWYQYDDDVVTEVPQNEVISQGSDVYLLFYRLPAMKSEPDTSSNSN